MIVSGKNMDKTITVEIDRDEMAVRIVEAIIAPDILVRKPTATETLEQFTDGMAETARLAAEAALFYMFACLFDYRSNTLIN